MRFLFGWQGIAMVGFIGIAVGLHLVFTDLLLGGLGHLRRNRLHVGTAARGAGRASRSQDSVPDPTTQLESSVPIAAHERGAQRRGGGGKTSGAE